MEQKISRPDNSSRNSLIDLLDPVLDYKWYITVFCISAALSSLALTYIYSEKYTAATTITYRPQEVTRLRVKEAIAFGAPSPTPPFDLIYDNLQILVKSEPVLLPVIHELGLDVEEPKVYEGSWIARNFYRLKDWVKQVRDDGWTILKHGRLVKDDPATAALKGVRKHLSLIDNSSYVFYLSFTDKDPARAAKVVDAIAERALRVLQAEARRPAEQEKEKLAMLLAKKKAEIEDYQQAIEALLVEHGLASLSLDMQHMAESYSELRLKRIELEAKIAAARASIAELNRQGAGVELPPPGLQPDDLKQLKSGKIAKQIELAALEKEYAALRPAEKRFEQQLSALPGIQHQYDSLVQNLKTAQRDLVQISDPYQEVAVEVETVPGELVIPHKARVPSIPVSPIKIYHVSLATGLAVALSFGLAYLVAFARSEQVARAVSRAVGNVVGMWDGVERRGRRDRRRPDAPPYNGVERRRQNDRRNDRRSSD